MKERAHLEEADICAIVRLLGDVADADGGRAARKRRLMDGLCALAGADLWVWTVGRVARRGEGRRLATLFCANLTVRQAALLAPRDEAYPPPEGRFVIDAIRRGRPVTCARRQWVGDAEWYASNHVRQRRTRLDIDHCLYSVAPLEQRDAAPTACAIALHRRRGRPAFDARDHFIVHAVVSELSWLSEPSAPGSAAESMPHLTPRQRVVLDLLLEGQGRKQIARQLRLSHHTVNDYVKAIYKRLDVNSRPQLMRRCLVGDRGVST